MELWGLTGLAGSGKSLALNFLKKHGAAVVDSDQIAKQVVDANTPEGTDALSEISQSFGPEVIDRATGQLNRRQLRARIAGSTTEQLRLEKILHPRILNAIRHWAEEQSNAGHTLGVIEGTRLVESGFSKQLKGMIFVASPTELQLERLQKRDSLSKEDAIKLISSQNEQLMRESASLVWSNGASPEELEAQVISFLKSKKGKGSTL